MCIRDRNTRSRTVSRPKVPRNLSWRSMATRPRLTLVACVIDSPSAMAPPLSRSLAPDAGPSQQFFHQVTNPPIDVIDDRADFLDGLPGRVFELPVEIALAGIDRAGIATTHGHDDVGLSGRLIVQWFREVLGDVEPPLLQDR